MWTVFEKFEISIERSQEKRYDCIKIRRLIKNYHERNMPEIIAVIASSEIGGWGRSEVISVSVSRRTPFSSHDRSEEIASSGASVLSSPEAIVPVSPGWRAASSQIIAWKAPVFGQIIAELSYLQLTLVLVPFQQYLKLNPSYFKLVLPLWNLNIFQFEVLYRPSRLLEV